MSTSFKKKSLRSFIFVGVVFSCFQIHANDGIVVDKSKTDKEIVVDKTSNVWQLAEPTQEIKELTASQAITPGKNWADSYSVNGKCYCATTFDHGIGNYKVQTPAGEKTVKEVCNKIGPGPGKGNNPVYNTVQCGHEPGHDDAIKINGEWVKDEKVCPGRVDQGSSGCNKIGPKWDLSVFETNDKDPELDFIQPTSNQTFSSGNLIIVEAEAKGPDGSFNSVTSVELFIDNEFVRKESNHPYDWKIDSDKAVFANLSSGDHTFKLVMTDDNGDKTTETINVTVSSTVTNTTSKFTKEQLSIYPNPSNEGLFLLSKPVDFEVYDGSGHQVLEGKGDNVDLSSYPKGIYILHVDDVQMKLIH